MIRARIRLDTVGAVSDFVSRINTDGTINKYTVESKTGKHRVDARSYLGMIYASAEFGGHTYLVNEVEDGKFPHFVYDFMPLSDNDGNYIHS